MMNRILSSRPLLQRRFPSRLAEDRPVGRAQYRWRCKCRYVVKRRWRNNDVRHDDGRDRRRERDWHERSSTRQRKPSERAHDLSVSLQVNRNNIPVTAQVPIAVAASVCGVSVDVLAASVASGKGTCTASTTSPQLTQAVQQQIASGGNVTGGPQTMGGTTPTNQMD